MILLLKLTDPPALLQFEISDNEVVIWPKSRNYEVIARERKPKVWKHYRGVSAIAKTEYAARLMMEWA